MNKKISIIAKSPGAPPWNQLWIKQEFDRLHREHAAILKRLDDFEPGDSITPELEEAVNQVSQQAVKIDEQVPDNNVPPRTASTKTNKKKKGKK